MRTTGRQARRRHLGRTLAVEDVELSESNFDAARPGDRVRVWMRIGQPTSATDDDDQQHEGDKGEEGEEAEFRLGLEERGVALDLGVEGMAKGDRRRIIASGKLAEEIGAGEDDEIVVDARRLE